MDNLRVGTRDPILLLTRAADRLVSLRPGETIRAQVAEMLPGGEVNLRIQGNLFRARSTLQLPQNASVLLRVLGQNTAEGNFQVHLQFLEVVTQSETSQKPQGSSADHLQTLTQELASNLAAKGPVPTALAVTVERLLKALPEDVTNIPAQTRGQLLTLLQANLRATGQSIQDRLHMFLDQFAGLDAPQVRELANVKEQVFADIETISQIPLKSALAKTGVALEARLRDLAEVLSRGGEGSWGNAVPSLTTDQSVGITQLPPSLKDALVQLSQQGVPLPPEVKQALQQLDLKGLALPAELKDALVQLSQQAGPLPSQPQNDPLPVDFKARLLQIREMVLEQQAQMLKLDLSERIASPEALKEKKELLEQMLQAVDGLLQDVESFQLLSKLTDSFYTFLPFIWKGLKEADIAFKRCGSGPRGRSYYCLVHLDLENLGKIEVVTMMTGSEFYITFKTDHDQFRSVLSTHMNELHEMFAAKGLKLGLTSIHDMQEKQLAPVERLEAFETLIDIRI